MTVPASTVGEGGVVETPSTIVEVPSHVVVAESKSRNEEEQHTSSPATIKDGESPCLIEQIQSLNLEDLPADTGLSPIFSMSEPQRHPLPENEDVLPTVEVPPQGDPMIFQPIYYGRQPEMIQNSEMVPSAPETPPEFADGFFPAHPEMAHWPGYPYHAMVPFNPEMQPHVVPFHPHPQGAPATWEVPCVSPHPELMGPHPHHPYLAYHSSPIFQPIPTTFAGQPYFHRCNNGGNNRGGCGGGGGGGGIRECYNCRRPGHLARNCGEVASDKQCFHCLKFGHVVRNCPQTRMPMKRIDDGDPRINNSLSSSPTYLEWSSDSGDPSDCADVHSPCGSSPMPMEFGFNPPDYDVNPTNARFYIIKSNSEQDVRASIENGVWCSTDHGNKKLDLAFKNHRTNGPTILLFSVNNSGKFCGIAEMVSRVDFNRESGIWSNNRFRGQFRVKWTHVKDVPNSALRHIYLANNDFKPVTFSRDTQEVPPREGKRMLYIVHKYRHLSSMLDPIAEKDCSEDDSASGSLDHLEGSQHEEDAPENFLLPSAYHQPHPLSFHPAVTTAQHFAPPYASFVTYPVIPYPTPVSQHAEFAVPQQQPHPYPYPSPPLVATPVSQPAPTVTSTVDAPPLAPVPLIETRPSPPPPLLPPPPPRQQQKQLQPQHQKRHPLPDIVDSLVEFPSLPKKSVATPLSVTG